jgi:hypothetical protein
MNTEKRDTKDLTAEEVEAWNRATRAWERQREQEIQDGFTSPAMKRSYDDEQSRDYFREETKP